jgi:hypothetical protein
MSNKNSQSTNEVFPSAVSSLTDEATSTTALTSININTANNFWVVHTVQLADGTDTAGTANIQINIDKP